MRSGRGEEEEEREERVGEGKDGNVESKREEAKVGKKEGGRKIEACDYEITLRNVMSYYVT